MAGRGCDRLQRADLVGDEVFDLRRFQSRHRPAAEAVQIAVAGMRADAYSARLRQFNGVAHDIGIAGMEAAGDVDRFASSIIAASLPISHAPNLSPRSQLRSTVFMLWSAFRYCIDCSFRTRCFGQLYREPGSGIDGADRTARDISIVQRIDVEINIYDSPQPVGQGAQPINNFLASAWASAMATALKRKARPAGICANRPKSAEMTVAILGQPPLVPRSRVNSIGWPLPGTIGRRSQYRRKRCCGRGDA